MFFFIVLCQSFFFLTMIKNSKINIFAHSFSLLEKISRSENFGSKSIDISKAFSILHNFFPRRGF